MCILMCMNTFVSVQTRITIPTYTCTLLFTAIALCTHDVYTCFHISSTCLHIYVLTHVITHFPYYTLPAHLSHTHVYMCTNPFV